MFSRKINKLSRLFSRKHLGVTCDVKLTFEEHLNNVLKKVNQTIGLLRKIQIFLIKVSINCHIERFS